MLRKLLMLIFLVALVSSARPIKNLATAASLSGLALAISLINMSTSFATQRGCGLVFFLFFFAGSGRFRQCCTSFSTGSGTSSST